jgi:hypothetical protein
MFTSISGVEAEVKSKTLGKLAAEHTVSNEVPNRVLPMRSSCPLPPAPRLTPHAPRCVFPVWRASCTCQAQVLIVHMTDMYITSVWLGFHKRVPHQDKGDDHGIRTSLISDIAEKI